MTNDDGASREQLKWQYLGEVGLWDLELIRMLRVDLVFRSTIGRPSSSAANADYFQSEEFAERMRGLGH